MSRHEGHREDSRGVYISSRAALVRNEKERQGLRIRDPQSIHTHARCGTNNACFRSFLAPLDGALYNHYRGHRYHSTLAVSSGLRAQEIATNMYR